MITQKLRRNDFVKDKENMPIWEEFMRDVIKRCGFDFDDEGTSFKLDFIAYGDKAKSLMIYVHTPVRLTFEIPVSKLREGKSWTPFVDLVLRMHDITPVIDDTVEFKKTGLTSKVINTKLKFDRKMQELVDELHMIFVSDELFGEALKTMTGIDNPFVEDWYTNEDSLEVIFSSTENDGVVLTFPFEKILDNKGETGYGGIFDILMEMSKYALGGMV